jgi:KaiC/GvpD/RAD55 family RecA-like ATPase
MEKRLKSGIPGLDLLVGGGFIEGSVNLLCGGAGTGKTIFGCQFLLQGLREGEPGLYVTLEEDREDILNDVAEFGWDKEFREYEKKGKFLLASEFPTKISDLQSKIVEAVERINAKRFVLDSLSIAEMGWAEEKDIAKLRREIFDLMRALKRIKTTSLLIAELRGTKALSTLGFEEFLADSVIVLHYLEYSALGTPRSLMIRKMRRTNHATEIFPFEITKKGIVVKKG